MKYYVFTDKIMTMVIEAQEVIDDYEQIEISDMTKNILYNSERNKIYYNDDKEEFLVIEKESEKNSKLEIVSNWDRGIEKWITALELVHNLTKYDIIKKIMSEK